METPVLTTKQIKSTLSAKKQRPKETLKNVLTFPFNNTYWPEISAEDQEELHGLLLKHMPTIRNKQVKIPWKDIKAVPKADRKAFREKCTEKIFGLQHKQSCDGINLGVNSMSKLLEKNLAQAVLLSAETTPRLLVQHIIDQAVLYTVPILCVANLKETLKSATGIDSVGVAFSKEIPSTNTVNLIIDKISNIFKTLPPPENHINYNRSLEPYALQDKKDEEPDQNKEIPKKETTNVDLIKIRNEVYLRRTDLKSRIFIPEVKETDTVLRKMDIDESGFIAFTEEPTEDLVDAKPKQSIGKYKSLVVKRLKGDPNRNKKKIQNLKRKKGKK